MTHGMTRKVMWCSLIEASSSCTEQIQSGRKSDTGSFFRIKPTKFGKTFIWTQFVKCSTMLWMSYFKPTCHPTVILHTRPVQWWSAGFQGTQSLEHHRLAEKDVFLFRPSKGPSVPPCLPSFLGWRGEGCMLTFDTRHLLLKELSVNVLKEQPTFTACFISDS